MKITPQTEEKIFNIIMSLLLLILIFVFVYGMFFYNPKRKAQFYVDGKPYYTTTTCIETKWETKWEYHYGYSFRYGKFCWHYGPNTHTYCIKEKIDTLQIK